MLVFVLEENGRNLARSTTDKFLSNFMQEACLSDAVIAMGASVNNPSTLVNQMCEEEKSGEPWGVVFFYGGHHAYMLDEYEKVQFIGSLYLNGINATGAQSYVLCKKLLKKKGSI